MEAQLRQNMLNVDAGRSLGDDQALGNLAIAQPMRRQPDHLALARPEPQSTPAQKVRLAPFLQMQTSLFGPVIAGATRCPLRKCGRRGSDRQTS
jgi:hypothetical protein